MPRWDVLIIAELLEYEWRVWNKRRFTPGTCRHRYNPNAYQRICLLPCEWVATLEGKASCGNPYVKTVSAFGTSGVRGLVWDNWNVRKTSFFIGYRGFLVYFAAHSAKKIVTSLCIGAPYDRMRALAWHWNFLVSLLLLLLLWCCCCCSCCFTRQILPKGSVFSLRRENFICCHTSLHETIWEFCPTLSVTITSFSPLHHTQLAGFINYPLGWSEYASYIRFCASYQFFVEIFVRFDVCMCQRTVRNQECEKTYIIFWMLILEHHLNTHFTICSLVAGFECALVGSIDWGCKLLQYFLRALQVLELLINLHPFIVQCLNFFGKTFGFTWHESMVAYGYGFLHDCLPWSQSKPTVTPELLTDQTCMCWNLGYWMHIVGSNISTLFHISVTVFWARNIENTQKLP